MLIAGVAAWFLGLIKFCILLGLHFFPFVITFFFFKKKILQLPKGRDVEDDDSFVFNEGFTAPLYRIKVWASVMQQYCDTLSTLDCLICHLDVT